MPGTKELSQCVDALTLCRSLVDAVPDVLLMVDREGTIQYLNRAGDFAAPAVPGTPVVELAAREVRDELRRALDEVFAGTRPRTREVPAPSADGSIRWYATSAAPVLKGGEVVGATIVARDVSEARKAENALRESEARYRTLVEHAPEAIVVLDADARCFVDANRKACVLFGCSREELLQLDPVKLSPPTQPGGVPSQSLAWQRIEEALAGGVPTFEWVHRSRHGNEVRCEVRLVRLPDSSRRLVRGSVTDVTMQRQLEEHVRQYQKVEALGQFASGIAHDFNNILTVISASADTLAEELPADAPIRLEAEWIRGAVQRGSALTGQLLTFARREGASEGHTELDPVISESSGLLGRLLLKQVDLDTVADAPGAMVRASRHEIEQVLMNLVLNARDAMPAGGTITIATTRVPPRAGMAGAAVRLRVVDTGMGMDETTRQRIFEAFFTTKPAGRGTGLGLSIVHGIVRQAGGWIEVASQPARGTTFDVFFPECAG